jgi:hypothetical protein
MGGGTEGRHRSGGIFDVDRDDGVLEGREGRRRRVERVLGRERAVAGVEVFL